MSKEVQGKLFWKSEITNGISKAQKPWQKIEFVIEEKDVQYPTKIAFSAMKADVIQFVNDTSLETEITVSYNLKAREYNNRWYNNVDAWKVEVNRDNGNPIVDMPPEPSISEADGDDLPF